MSVEKFGKEDPAGHVTNAKFARGVSTLRGDVNDLRRSSVEVERDMRRSETDRRYRSIISTIFLVVGIASVLSVIVLDGRETRGLIRELRATSRTSGSPVGKFTTPLGDAFAVEPNSTETPSLTIKKRNVVR